MREPVGPEGADIRGKNSEANDHRRQTLFQKLQVKKRRTTLLRLEYPIFHSTASSTAPLVTTLCVNGSELVMQVDTGAALSLISESTYRSLGSTAPNLQKASVKLRTYLGEELGERG